MKALPTVSTHASTSHGRQLLCRTTRWSQPSPICEPPPFPHLLFGKFVVHLLPSLLCPSLLPKPPTLLLLRSSFDSLVASMYVRSTACSILQFLLFSAFASAPSSCSELICLHRWSPSTMPRRHLWCAQTRLLTDKHLAPSQHDVVLGPHCHTSSINTCTAASRRPEEHHMRHLHQESSHAPAHAAPDSSLLRLSSSVSLLIHKPSCGDCLPSSLTGHRLGTGFVSISSFEPTGTNAYCGSPCNIRLTRSSSTRKSGICSDWTMSLPARRRCDGDHTCQDQLRARKNILSHRI